MYYKKGLSKRFNHYIDKNNNRIFYDFNQCYGDIIRQIQTDKIMLDSSDGEIFQNLMISLGYIKNKKLNCFIPSENKHMFIKKITSTCQYEKLPGMKWSKMISRYHITDLRK